MFQCLCCSAGLGPFHAVVHCSHNKCGWLVLPPSMEGDNIPPADDEIIAAYDGDGQVLRAAAALADFVVPRVSDGDGLDGENPECSISHCMPQLEGSQNVIIIRVCTSGMAPTLWVSAKVLGTCTQERSSI